MILDEFGEALRNPCDRVADLEGLGAEGREGARLEVEVLIEVELLRRLDLARVDQGRARRARRRRHDRRGRLIKLAKVLLLLLVIRIAIP